MIKWKINESDTKRGNRDRIQISLVVVYQGIGLTLLSSVPLSTIQEEVSVEPIASDK